MLVGARWSRWGAQSATPNDPFRATRGRAILARELVRQAVLIAARDELGLSTRDQVLGDQPVAIQENKRVELTTVVAPGVGGPIRVLIRRIAEDRVESILDHELLDPKASPDDLAKLAEIAEAMSRTEIPGVLRKLGLEGKPNTLRTDGGLPREIDQRLSGLSFTELFSAVRDLHAMIRSEGESPARLGALIRGYALLGLLTEFQWHPAHKVFKARALLYARRLVARDPKAAWGYWHRANARALAGLHKDALADLAEAQTRARAADNTPTPDWVELIDACARCDARRLEAAGGEGPRQARRHPALDDPGIPPDGEPDVADGPPGGRARAGLLPRDRRDVPRPGCRQYAHRHRAWTAGAGPGRAREASGRVRAARAGQERPRPSRGR